ncbi:MAG TPA: hypothetical protein VE955_01850 [Candidatus Dormibacteraeota bacterium]|jgi:hypothetical protein|nr:hypothetical protein [Candidatus Dormibacteraeota bacterium]
MDPPYVAGKCNIGRRGRAIRLSTGVAFIALSVILSLTLLGRVYWAVRLVLVIPIYVGLVAALEGTMSFCVLHAARGTYDFHEPLGFASKKSRTLNRVRSDADKKLDHKKAVRMHAEAVAGAALLALLLALA